MRVIYWFVKLICNVPPPDPVLNREYYPTQRAKDQADLAWYDWRGLRRVRFMKWYRAKYVR